MTTRELKKKQHKVARGFFEKFKEKFNVEDLERNGTGKFQYGKWYFENCEESTSLSNFSIFIKIGDYDRDQHYIHGSRRLMRKIKWFIIKEYNGKQETLNIQRLLAELEPIESQITTDFTSALDTYDSLDK